MQLELRLGGLLLPQLDACAYDSDEDDIRSILVDACRVIGEHSDFLVSGFGQDRWPVDVATDLPVFLEQLPKALRAVSSGAAFEFDFYEQGIERTIAFSPTAGHYAAVCRSRTSWQPDPAIEEVDRGDLEEMLLNLREEFMRAFAQIGPSLIHHEWVRHWLLSPDD